MYARRPKKVVYCLGGCCEGLVASIFVIFTRLRRLGLSVDFETLFESIWQVVADLWRMKRQMGDSFSICIVLMPKSMSNQAMLIRMDYSVIFKISVHS